jgi:lysophospholipase L1-like esterase
MSFKIVAVGTSVMWGQGLHEEQKIHALVKQMLQEKRNEPIDAYLLAHSGAIIGLHADDTEDTTQLERVHGEVPTPYPTLLQQLAEFDGLEDQIGAAEDVDVVLVEGGINDVNIVKILDPLTRIRGLKQMIEMHCHHHVKLLLQRVAAKFPNATIVVLAYYPMLNDRSEDEHMSELLYAVGARPGGLIADIPISFIANMAKRKILANCDVFHRESRRALEAAVNELNTEISDGHSPRAILAVPNFSANNTIWADDPWLFSINPDMSPQDELAQERCVACEEAGNLRTVVTICKRASNGHPNEKGAKAYAEAVVAVLQNALMGDIK